MIFEASDQILINVGLLNKNYLPIICRYVLYKGESYAIVDHITMFQVSLDVESVVRDILRPNWSGVRSPAVSQSPPGDLPPKYEDLGQ